MNVLGSSPRRGHCVVFLLSKTLYFHGASLHPVVINGYLQNNAGEGGGGTLRWTISNYCQDLGLMFMQNHPCALFISITPHSYL